MYVNVVFVISCCYSAVSLILVREQRFIIRDSFHISRRIVEVLMSPQGGGLQVASGWNSSGRLRVVVSRSPWRSGLHVAAERMYSGHCTIGLQVTTAWRFPSGHRMRAYICWYLSSNPKPRLGTRCSAHSKPWFPGWK